MNIVAERCLNPSWHETRKSLVLKSLGACKFIWGRARGKDRAAPYINCGCGLDQEPRIGQEERVNTAHVHEHSVQQISSVRRQEHTGPKCWTSEMFGETRTSLGTNLLGVFSCVGSFWKNTASVWSDSTCKLNCIRDSDWLCASKSAQCVGAAEVTMVCTPFRHFLFSCFGLLARD